MDAEALDREMREHISGYLEDRLSLRDFRTWFILQTEQIDLRHASPLRDLYGEIELRLAEYTSDHLTEQELRELLAAALRQPSRA